MKTFEEQVAHQIRLLWVAIAILGLATVLTLGISTWGWVRITNDEHATCIVQARGLPAGHHLAAALADIGKLVSTDSPTPGISVSVGNVLTDLQQQAADYAAIEDRQPAARTC